MQLWDWFQIYMTCSSGNGQHGGDCREYSTPLPYWHSESTLTMCLRYNGGPKRSFRPLIIAFIHHSNGQNWIHNSSRIFYIYFSLAPSQISIHAFWKSHSSFTTFVYTWLYLKTNTCFQKFLFPEHTLSNFSVPLNRTLNLQALRNTFFLIDMIGNC